MKTLLLLPLLLLLNGCVSQHAKLEDRSKTVSVTTAKDGSSTTNTTERTITTDLSGSAWFSSKQSVEKFKALQTDKTQSIGGNNLVQQGATNVVEALEKIDSILKTVAGGAK